LTEGCVSTHPSLRVCFGIIVAAGAIAASWTPAPAAPAYTKQGVLTCSLEASRAITQSKPITCTFARAPGGTENYTGSLRKVGVAFGRVGAGVIVWTVLSSNGAPGRGDVGGSYFRATSDEAAGVGVGPHVLIGGAHRWFALQPISAAGEVSFDYAQNITGLVLDERR
jgi:hypothetical protein